MSEKEIAWIKSKQHYVFFVWTIVLETQFYVDTCIFKFVLKMLYENCCVKHVFYLMEVGYDPYYFCGGKKIA